MKKPFSSALFLAVCVTVLLQKFAGVVALPLYTKSRWIVDEDGKRVRLACVNWISHTEALLAEGLNKSPLDRIARNIEANGFNCVRLTWPISLPTNKTLASISVETWFKNLGLIEALGGILINNPDFLSLTIVEAFQTIVRRLGHHNVMVILDNHVSKASWCCTMEDGNGFFGDRFFNPILWLKGITNMAGWFRGVHNVIGMSIRNELRGPRQNITIWRKYMQKGAEAVHLANPDLLVILSGLFYDNDLSFLHQAPVQLTFTGKLVFEVHRFGVSIKNTWAESNPNDVCGSFTSIFMFTAGFLLQQGYPLFLSEFGGDQRGTSVNDNRFLNCAFAMIADLDFDWALWALQGSYYMRPGATDLEETWGVLNKEWNGVRNKTYMRRVDSIQLPYQGPGLYQVPPYNILYHPASGMCILHRSGFQQLRLGLCKRSQAWTYDVSRQTIKLLGTKSCLQAVGHGKPIRLGSDCHSSDTKWEMISRSRLHLSTILSNGNQVCMDIDNYVNGVIITTECSCLRADPLCDPGGQWFKIIKSTRKPRRLEDESEM